MFSSFIFVFVSVFIAGCTLCTAQTYNGDQCFIEKTRKLGVCQNLNDCASAKEDVKSRINPQMCGFIRRMPIVCCDLRATSTAAIDLTTDRDSTTVREPIPVRDPTTVREPIPVRDPIPVREPTTVRDPITSSIPQTPLIRPTNPQREICLNSPLKENAVRVTKTGRKAWDKCIDLADSVYPCVPAGFTINARFVRNFECSNTAVPLVNGGIDTVFGEFPHMASLGFASHRSPNITWKCGGILISDQWVLTAAQCLSLGSVTHIRLGGVDENEPTHEDYLFTVIAKVPHPDYKPPAKYQPNTQNDIALLKLDKKVIFSRQVRPACLHTGEEINDDKGILTGWGSTKLEGKDSYNLLKTTVEKFSFSECSNINTRSKSSFKNGRQNPTQICYGQRTPHQNICTGECGGALQISNNDRVQCTYLVFGITSNDNFCVKPNKPTVFTRVSAYISWIEDTVWPDNENA